MAKKAVKKVATKKAVKKSSEPKLEEIIYPEVSVSVCQGDNALTVEQAKQLLGWEVVDKDKDYGDKVLLTDHEGNKVVCWSNTRNRPFSLSLALTNEQELLRGHWRLNGETVIIGEKGACLSGQHRLVGLVLAEQSWRKDPDRYPACDGAAPTCPTLLVVGISEADEVVNTIDTGRPRSLSDVLFRSEFFGNVKAADRRVLARICDYAVRTLWHRTGVDRDAFAPKRTHAESIDFLTRHPKLIDAVRHIWDENGDTKRIGQWLGEGYAAGLLFLMGSGNNDPAGPYRASSAPHDGLLNWALFDGACEFWTLLAGGNKVMEPVKDALALLMEQGQATNAARMALVVKAWNAWIVNKAITSDDLELKFQPNDDGVNILAECPTVGGVDLGSPLRLDDIVTPEEVDEVKDQIVKEAQEAKQATPKKSTAKVTEADVGQTVWVLEDPLEASWSGTLLSFTGNKAVVKVGKVFASAGKELTVDRVSLSSSKP